MKIHALIFAILAFSTNVTAEEPVQIVLDPVFVQIAGIDEEEPQETEGDEVPDVSVEVNIPATEMRVYEKGEVMFVKPIAIGSGVYPTPVKESAIKKIEWNPWWYPPDSGWAAGEKPTSPGPRNPMGRVKMAISEGILFHGTNRESSVGQPVSHGCMRMYNEDAVEVAWFLQGHFSDKTDPSFLETYRKNSRTTYVVELNAEVPVRLIYKPVVVKDETLFLYPDFYRRLTNQKKAAIMTELETNGIATDSVDEAKIDEIVKKWGPKTIEVPIEELKPQPPTEGPSD